MTVDPLFTVEKLALYEQGEPTALIAQATALVRRYCGWHVAPLHQETVVLQGNGARQLVLPSLRVFSVDAVVNGGRTYTAEDYSWSVGGVLTRAPAAGVWVLDAPVSVTFTHGFDSAPDVESVVAGIVARAKASPNGAVREQAGPFAVTYSQTGFNVAGGVSFLEQDRATLDRYRLAPRP